MTTITEGITSFLSIAGAQSAQTARTYQAVLKHLLTFLASRQVTPDAPTTLLTPNLVREFIAWLASDYRSPAGERLSKNSRVLYHTALNRFYHHLLVSKWLAAEVDLLDYEALQRTLMATAKRQADPLEKRLPDQAIVDALIAQARQPLALSDTLAEKSRHRLLLAWYRDQAIVLMLQSSGLRVGELVALRRSDLDYAKQGAYVTGKGDKVSFVRFSAEAWAALQRYLGERADGQLPASLAGQPVVCRHDKRAGENHRLPLSTNSVREIIERLAQAANLAGRFHMTPHRLRHYFATRLLRETNNLALTQTSLGHSDPKTTRIYADVSQADLIAAHQRVFDQASGPEKIKE